MTDSAIYLRAFDAFVLVAEALRAESIVAQSLPSESMLRQANSLIETLNKQGDFGFRLEPVVNGPWTAILRQITLVLEIAGPIRDSLVSTHNASVPLNETSLVDTSRPGKPKIFIGCSVEGLPVGKIIQLQLRYSADTSVWHQGVFGLSKGTLETLVGKCRDFDYAVLVLTSDDVVVKRDVPANAARDNVLFELGLFIGALGPDRVFMVVEDQVELPTDLAGIKPALFKGSSVGPELQVALGPVVTELELAMQIL